MSLFDLFRPQAVRPPIASPWATSHLARVTKDAILGMESSTVTRDQAMQIPAVVKGRGLICGTLAKHPIAVYDGDVRLETPQWLIGSSASGISPQERMIYTLDDLIFNGQALWLLERGISGEIVDAQRVPPDSWVVEEDQTIVVTTWDGQRLAPRSDELCLFAGPQDGLLQIAASTIQAALNLENAWAQRVAAPIPLVELHGTDRNAVYTEEEIRDLLGEWEAARTEGGTAFTPFDIEMRVHGQAITDLFIQGRNALRLDIANFLNVPAGLLEGSTSTASLTYQTSEGQRNELVDYSLSYWALPIEARLSQDDILPPGLQATFDLSALVSVVQDPRGPRWED